jgi:hypothetical protein
MNRVILFVCVLLGVAIGQAHAGIDYTVTARGERRASGGRWTVWDSLALARLIMEQNNAIDPQTFGPPSGVVDGSGGIDPGNALAAGYLVFGPSNVKLTYDRRADKYVVQALFFDDFDREGASIGPPPIPLPQVDLVGGDAPDIGSSPSGGGGGGGGASPAITPPSKPTPDITPQENQSVPVPAAAWSGLVLLGCLGSVFLIRRLRPTAHTC